MQYFVSIENNSYYHWQIELLIQSFKALKLENDLIIAVAQTDSPVFAENTKLLSKHKHVFFHENKGSINQSHALFLAIRNSIIKPPFALLHPHSVLVKPIFDEFNIAYQPEKNDLNLEKFIEKIVEWREIKREELPKIDVGDTIFFGEIVPELFFERFWNRSEQLGDLRAALTLTIYEFIGNLTVKETQFESNLLSFNLYSTINYKHGLPPVFHKRHFKGDVVFASNQHPYDVLLEHNPTLATNYLQKLINEIKS